MQPILCSALLLAVLLLSCAATPAAVLQVGAYLQDVAPAGLHSVFERFRAILHEGAIDRRCQYMIEGLFAVRKVCAGQPVRGLVPGSMSGVQDSWWDSPWDSLWDSWWDGPWDSLWDQALVLGRGAGMVTSALSYCVRACCSSQIASLETKQDFERSVYFVSTS